ncbi:hypothetical protein NDU88_004580, partial [Pleurodeles waltl]
MRLVAYERKGESRTLCVLPERNEEIQLRALSWIPASWRRFSRVRWHTVSKAAERSRRMRAEVSPLSICCLMSSVAAKSA